MSNEDFGGNINAEALRPLLRAALRLHAKAAFAHKAILNPIQLIPEEIEGIERQMERTRKEESKLRRLIDDELRHSWMPSSFLAGNIFHLSFQPLKKSTTITATATYCSVTYPSPTA